MGILERWDSRNDKAMKNVNKLKTYDELYAELGKGKWGRVSNAIWTAQLARVGLVMAAAALGLIVWAVRATF